MPVNDPKEPNKNNPFLDFSTSIKKMFTGIEQREKATNDKLDKIIKQMVLYYKIMEDSYNKDNVSSKRGKESNLNDDKGFLKLIDLMTNVDGKMKKVMDDYVKGQRLQSEDKKDLAKFVQIMQESITDTKEQIGVPIKDLLTNFKTLMKDEKIDNEFKLDLLKFLKDYSNEDMALSKELKKLIDDSVKSNKLKDDKLIDVLSELDKNIEHFSDPSIQTATFAPYKKLDADIKTSNISLEKIVNLLKTNQQGFKTTGGAVSGAGMKAPEEGLDIKEESKFSNLMSKGGKILSLVSEAVGGAEFMSEMTGRTKAIQMGMKGTPKERGYANMAAGGGTAGTAIVDIGEWSKKAIKDLPKLWDGMKRKIFGGKQQVPLSKEQVGNASIIRNVGKKMGATDKDIQTAIATAYRESGLKNRTYGDKIKNKKTGKMEDSGSRGLFQQRSKGPGQGGYGWGTREQTMDPEHASMMFYQRMMKVTPDAKKRDAMALTRKAANVQQPRKDLRGAYAPYESMATDVNKYLLNQEKISPAKNKSSEGINLAQKKGVPKSITNTIPKTLSPAAMAPKAEVNPKQKSIEDFKKQVLSDAMFKSTYTTLKFGYDDSLGQPTVTWKDRLNRNEYSAVPSNFSDKVSMAIDDTSTGNTKANSIHKANINPQISPMPVTSPPSTGGANAPSPSPTGSAPSQPKEKTDRKLKSDNQMIDFYNAYGDLN